MGNPRFVVGIDSSLDGTGLSRVYQDGSFETCVIKPGNLRDFARMEYVVNHVTRWVGNAAMVAMEGPALGYDGDGQQGRHENAGMWWQIAMAVAHTARVPLAYVSPGTLKMYATGDGGCSKLAVMMELRAQYGFTIADADQGDALVLGAMAADHLGFALHELPQKHRRALDSVLWPKPGDPAGISLFANTKATKATKATTKKATKARASRRRKKPGEIELLLGPDEVEVPLPLMESVG